MEQWSEIRRRVLVERVSRRQIIRETGMHWETLQKILAHSEPPGYRQRRPRPRNKLGACLPKIELMLQEDMALPRKHAEMLSKFRMGSSAQFETECNETARCINSFKDTGQ